MCDRCPKARAIELADTALATLPDFQTRKIDMVTDMRAWIQRASHVTEKQLKLLADFAGEEVPEGPAPLPDGAAMMSGARQRGLGLVLLSCALVDHRNGNVLKAESRARELIDQSRVCIVPSSGLDWNKLRADAGGWEGAYAWAARSFDILILVEMGNGLLGRGQYQLGEEFEKLGKRVAVLREKITACRVEVNDQNNWKEGFGRCVPIAAN